MLENEIVIVGGGLAGLTAAYLLAKSGKKVLVIEKKAYPFHRVCGEYVSNEVRDFLQKEHLYPSEHYPAEIKNFRLSAIDGKTAEIPLDLGGFGISRFVLDHHFYQRCLQTGVRFKQKCQVLDVVFDSFKKIFSLTLDDGSTILSSLVLGAFGKRSKLDKTFDREFTKTRSPFIGVKYHIQLDHDPHTVALHNFKGGYCGINKIENGLFNLCYLGSREQLKSCGTIGNMEEKYLYSNPRIREIFENSKFLWERPEVINEISFSPKKPVENHMLMIGDAAGMITPLCGNGMAIAIHTGKLAAESVLKYHNLEEILAAYEKDWQRFFSNRLAVGRKVQGLFGTGFVSKLSVGFINLAPTMAGKLIRQTHGVPV